MGFFSHDSKKENNPAPEPKALSLFDFVCPLALFDKLKKPPISNEMSEARAAIIGAVAGAITGGVGLHMLNNVPKAELQKPENQHKTTDKKNN